VTPPARIVIGANMAAGLQRRYRRFRHLLDPAGGLIDEKLDAYCVVSLHHVSRGHERKEEISPELACHIKQSEIIPRGKLNDCFDKRIRIVVVRYRTAFVLMLAWAVTAPGWQALRT
jgi:hypothetical protein